MFYKCRHEIEKKGCYGIVDSFYPNMEHISNFHEIMDSPTYCNNLPKNSIPSFEPFFPKFALKWGSKEVDFVADIYISDWGGMENNGFIVSKKVKSILEEFKLPQHIFYPLIYCRRISKGVYEDMVDMYFYCHFIHSSKEEWIEFSNSTFVHRYIKDDRKVNVNFDSVEDLMNKSQFEFDTVIDYVTTQYDNLKFNSTYDGTDLFWLNECTFGRPFFISEKLKNCFEEEKITGLEDYNKAAIVL